MTSSLFPNRRFRNYQGRKSMGLREEQEWKGLCGVRRGEGKDK